MPDPLGPIQDAEQQLRAQFVDLSRLWRSVREDWRDERARAFEERYLADLGPSLSRLDAALSEFMEAVRTADRALQDPGDPGEDRSEGRWDR